MTEPYTFGFVAIHLFIPGHYGFVWESPNRPYNYETDSPEFRKRTYPDPNLIEVTLENGRRSVGYP